MRGERAKWDGGSLGEASRIAVIRCEKPCCGREQSNWIEVS